MKTVNETLTLSVLIPLGLNAVALAAYARYRKKS